MAEEKKERQQKSTFSTYNFGGNSPRYQHKTRKLLRSMARVSPRSWADGAVKEHGIDKAFHTADDTFRAIERAILNGGRVEFISSEELQRNYGFWKSVRQYLEPERRKEKARRAKLKASGE